LQCISRRSYGSNADFGTKKSTMCSLEMGQFGL
jgi:hypothetical protein